MDKISKQDIVNRAFPWVGMVVVLALLVAHTFKFDWVQIDNNSLFLLGFLCILPSLGVITKLKIGDFVEAEFSRQVAELRANTSGDLPPAPLAPATQMAGIKTDKYSSIMELVRQDPRLGLAKLRMELEQTLRALHRIVDPDKNPRRTYGLASIVKGLASRGLVNQQNAGALREVINLANRAIHGENVRPGDAEDLALLGVQLLELLADVFEEQVAAPLQSKVITHDEFERYMSSRYRVTTIVPYVNNPQMNVRVLDQESLDSLIDGYAEYAEFLVSIERIDSDN